MNGLQNRQDLSISHKIKAHFQEQKIFRTSYSKKYRKPNLKNFHSVPSKVVPSGGSDWIRTDV